MPSVSVPNTFTPSTTISSSQVNANFAALVAGVVASIGIAGADTMTGQFKAANGTAAAPGVTFGADLDIGLYRKAANELGFATAGVQAGYFDASQKLWLDGALDVAGELDVGGQIIAQGVIQLGHATDTTISRVSAGRIAVEGSNVMMASDIGTSLQAFDADTLKADVSDNLEVGFTSNTPDQGTKSSGTFTPAYATGNFQHCVNGGAFTLAPPSGNGYLLLDVTNNGSAGTITTSGFTKVLGAFTTTNGHKFRCMITTGNGGSLLSIVALQ